jgi:2-(1,2-epoxy-1,2-dihydrophenyl)acetyl-CoA isomerase
MSKLVSVEQRNGATLIGLNDPEHLNAFSVPLLEELCSVVTEEAAKGACRFVFHGHGTSFSSGAHMPDYFNTLEEVSNHRAHRFYESERKLIELGRILRRPRTFSIAAVHGWTVGIGVELAVACDFIVAAADTHFWLPETSVGWNAGMGMTNRLTRAVGAGWARRLMLLGEKIDASKAEQIGLIAAVANNGGQIDAALGILNTIAAKSPLAVQYEKLLLDMLPNISDEQAVEVEIITGYWLSHTHDVREAAQAFVEKREPKFIGE